MFVEKRMLVAVGLLAVVGGAFAYTRTRRDPHLKKASSATAAGGAATGAPTIKAADVDELEVSEAGKPKVVLKKDASGWNVVEPVKDRADQKNVEAALDTLQKMQWKAVVAESKGSWDKLQIGDDKVMRVVLRKGGQPLTTLLLGKGANVRLEGEDRVWSVGELNRFALAREPKMWRDRELIRVDKDQIDRIEIVNDAGVKVAAHRVPPVKPAPEEKPADPADPKKPPAPPPQEKWVLVEGADAVGGALDEAVPGNIAMQLVRLDASDFGDGATDDTAGLTKPRVTVTVVLLDGTKQVLLLGKDDGQDVFVKRPDATRIHKIRHANADNMLKAPLQWRDKVLAKVEPKDVVKVDLVAGANGGEHAAFERVDEKTWKLLTPADLGAELDSFKVQGLITGFANLRATSIAAPGADPKTFGFDKPGVVITVNRKAGAPLVLTVGALVDKLYYVKISGRPEVFQLAEMGAKRFLKVPADFKKSPAPPPGEGPPGMPQGHGGMMLPR